MLLLEIYGDGVSRYTHRNKKSSTYTAMLLAICGESEFILDNMRVLLLLS